MVHAIAKIAREKYISYDKIRIPLVFYGFSLCLIPEAKCKFMANVSHVVFFVLGRVLFGKPFQLQPVWVDTVVVSQETTLPTVFG